MNHFFLLTLTLLMAMTLSAQVVQPWTGGLNACQFGRLDLDVDGQDDLVVFDRQGNRLLCFLNEGAPGEVRYEYTNVYDSCFPELKAWAIFADYDGDGHKDIFTYSQGWAGIKVYRNTSTSGYLGFELVVSPYLSSWQGGGEVNILATEADYPGIVDLDGDGDLDLLTFGVLGTFIEKHVNLSMERFGCRDSLVFERLDPCWGRVGESEEDNAMYLDTCLFGKGFIIDMDGFRHRGATFGVRDLNGDGLLDLLLADVDYPSLILLTNGGDTEQALMVNQTDRFPQHHPVRLHSMPAAFFTDINNDGVDDLLVSPFDPDPMACEGFESIWLYLNHGTNERPDFQLYSKSFLQDQMLDLGTGAYPLVVDWDGDGRLDVLVGTVGNIDSAWYHYGNLETHRSAALTWLKNVGTQEMPVFQQMDFPFAGNMGLMGLVPACYDLDGDGRQELVLGTSEGRLLLYDHDGTLLDDDFLHYDKAWSAPCFFDVDADGAVDLVVGNSTGRLSFYRSCSTQPFSGSVEHFWGGVDVRDYTASYYGYSVPTLFAAGDRLYLAVGSESGKVFLYEGISVEEQAVFTEVSDQWTAFCPEFSGHLGMRSSVAVADLDRSGQVDLLVGNFGGGLQLYNAEIPVCNLGVVDLQETNTVRIFPNPVSSQLRIISKEGDIKLLRISDLYGRTLQEIPDLQKEVVIEVDALCPGVYVLRLVLERGAVSRIFLKR